MDRKHSAVAKAAVVHAVEQQGMTAEQIATLAAKGQLKAPGKRERLAPFEIAQSTIKEYARLARRRAREASTNDGHDPDYGTPPVAATGSRQREKPKPTVERDGPAKLGELFPHLIDEIEQERKLTAEAIAAAPGKVCRCDTEKPRLTFFDEFGITCENCRLPIKDWKARLKRPAGSGSLCGLAADLERRRVRPGADAA